MRDQHILLVRSARQHDAAIDAIKADGGDYTVQPWDWYRYASRIKAERYDLDEDAVAQYFQLDKVLEDGVFYAANKLYGLSFKRRTDLPTYHPDVWVYTVYDADGSELGLFYFDPFQRPSKRGGAWMSNFVDQSHLWGTKPVIYNVLNIPKAAPGEVQLVAPGAQLELRLMARAKDAQHPCVPPRQPVDGQGRGRRRAQRRQQVAPHHRRWDARLGIEQQHR